MADRLHGNTPVAEPGSIFFRVPVGTCLIIVFLAVILSASGCLAAAEAAIKPLPADAKILILNSYHHGYTWSDNELDGILDTFRVAGLKTAPFVEYLDSKHFPKYIQFSQLRNLFAVKYSVIRPDLVIVMDNPAFEFAVKYRRELFPGIPMVFIGLNDYDPSMLKGEKGITGVVERQDMVGTVRAAMEIEPDLKEVVIVHDYTASGRASRTEAHQQLAKLDGKLAIRYLPEMSIDEVVAELAKLKRGSAVLAVSFSRDKAGVILNHARLARTLGENSPVPVYGTKVERLGYGIIGGSLMEGKSHAAIGAELALRILHGESADDIKVVTDPPSTLMFDNNILKKFKMERERLPDGSRVINVPPGLYEQHGTVINVAGGIIAFLGISLAMVITANRRRALAEAALLESERKRARELEIANSEMESFCYAVSHDLQSPLRHINSYSCIIDDEYADLLGQEGRYYFTRIKAASSRMGQLIKDLLMLSQISREAINRTEFDLGRLALEVFEEHRIDDGCTNADVQIEDGVIVRADRHLVRVVLDNLIGNALKYSAKAELARIRVGVLHENGREIHFVSDNGVGFDMQYVDKLFVPFQRLHEASSFEGNGIGLATVQRVIHRHGGEVWAESRPDCGATFFFTLNP